MEQKPWEFESFCMNGSNGAPYCLIKYPESKNNLFDIMAQINQVRIFMGAQVPMLPISDCLIKSNLKKQWWLPCYHLIAIMSQIHLLEGVAIHSLDWTGIFTNAVVNFYTLC